MSAAGLRRQVATALARTPLIGPAVRLREMWRAYTAPRGPQTDANGAPVPGRFLRVLVVGHADADNFLSEGARAIAFFDDMLAQAGGSFAQAETVLDFGCGCGRLARHLRARTQAQIIGRDISAPAVRWCARHLDGDFKTNALAPPLDLPDASIDVGYALSVLTHLDDDKQRAWFAEWARVMRPGGRFIATFHDPEHKGALPETAATVIARGFAVQSAGMEGSNHFSSFQTLAHLAEIAGPQFALGPARPSRETPFRQAVAVFHRAS